MEMILMSNVDFNQDLWEENKIDELLERAEPFRKAVGSSYTDLEQYLANRDYEGAERLVERFENDVPTMLHGRYNEPE
jgi:hypothetical protein